MESGNSTFLDTEHCAETSVRTAGTDQRQTGTEWRPNTEARDTGRAVRLMGFRNAVIKDLKTHTRDVTAT